MPLAELVRTAAERHRAEQVFQEGKEEVGLGRYEVRSWVGWHHHRTLSLLAPWFLSLTRWQQFPIGGRFKLWFRAPTGCISAACAPDEKTRHGMHGRS